MITEDRLPNQDVSNLILAMSLSIYILVALYSTIFSLRRLKRPGVSAQVRKLFQRKHTVYVFLFILVWIVKLSASYYKLFNPNTKASSVDTKDEDIEAVITSVANYVSLATGMLLAGVRFNEPFFRYLVKNFVQSCFGILPDGGDEGI